MTDEQRSLVRPATDGTAVSSQEKEALRIVIRQLELNVRELSQSIDVNDGLEPEGILISATQMQDLCDETLAFVSRTWSTNSQHAALNSCLE
jgi:hypothetical protein